MGHSGRSAKDCSVNYLAPNLVSIQAEIDILSGKPNANTEGGFKLTLLGYNFGRPEPYSDLPYDEPLNGLSITPTTLSNLLVIGKSYTIVTSNSLDWTAVGAVDSQVGTVFTATSSNLGTGGTATALGGENDPLVVKIKGIVCPIISHGHNKIVCQMSEGEGRDLAVDVSLYHNDTDSSNPKIDDIKATWQNGNRNIEKSDFYSKVSRIQYHFDPPVVNKLWIEHEDYTISIQNGDVDYDGKSHKNKKFGLNYKNEVIHLLNSTGKRGPGLPTSGKSLKGNKDLWIHIEGKNFGSSASSRQIDVKSHVLHPEGVWDGWQLLAGEIERVDSVNAQGENQHRHLKFKLLPGEGQNLKFSLQIQDQPISNLDYGKYDIYAQNSDYFENDVFVGPNLINISYAQPRLDLLTAEGHGSAGDIGDYIFPTSGCGKFIVANLDEDGKLKCDFKTTFVLEGENFGKTMPLVLVHDAEKKIVEVTVFENCDSYCRNKIEYDIKDQPKLDEKGITIKCSNGCDSEKEPKFRTDTKLMLEVPPGVGSSMVEVRTRDVNVITDSNLLKQSPPGLDAASDETNEAIPAPLRRRLSRRDLSRRRLQRLDSRKSVYGRASNSQTFDYSSPDILDTRFGVDIDSAYGSGVVAAIGSVRMGEEQNIPWRFFILGENFGETEPLVDLRMTPIYSDNQLTGWMPNKIGGNKNGQTIYCRSRPSNVLSSAATDWGQFKYCPDKNAKCYEGGSDSEYGICKIQDLNYLNITLVHEYYARGMESITPCISRKEATASNGQSLTDVLDKSTACRYYQDIMSCYPPGYCVDVANKDIIASQITSSVDALKILGVNDCTLKCGAGHEPFLTKTVEEPCLNATWHSHTKHPWRYSGRPMLSCLVPPTTVGRKRIKVDVATIEVTMDITLDARCFEGFYGKIGEYCAQCWNYIQRHPNIPDAIETVYAAECYANYDSDVGTSEPVSHRGFAILPPQDCQNGGCKISAKCCLDGNCRYKEMTPAMVDSYDVESCETGISDEVVIDGEKQGYNGAGGVYVENLPDSYDTIPEECLENEKGEDGEFDMKNLLICQEGTRPGTFCHPTRVKGNITLFDGVGDSKKEIGKIPMDAARTICPHIMPCEPPESCDEGGVCNHDTGYVGYYKPYFLERDRDSGKQIRICNRVHWTLPEVVKFVEGSDPEKEIGHTCEFDDMFYSRDIDNGRNGGKDSIVDGLLADCEIEFCRADFAKTSEDEELEKALAGLRTPEIIQYVVDGVYDKYGDYEGKTDEKYDGELFAGAKHLGVMGKIQRTNIDFTSSFCLFGQ